MWYYVILLEYTWYLVLCYIIRVYMVCGTMLYYYSIHGMWYYVILLEYTWYVVLCYIIRVYMVSGTMLYY